MPASSLSDLGNLSQREAIKSMTPSLVPLAIESSLPVLPPKSSCSAGMESYCQCSLMNTRSAIGTLLACHQSDLQPWRHVYPRSQKDKVSLFDFSTISSLTLHVILQWAHCRSYLLRLASYSTQHLPHCLSRFDLAHMGHRPHDAVLEKRHRRQI